MDYQTNLEIAQDDQRFPAYRVELRSPFDRKYVKSYDNLAQGANTAFAPQGGHNGLWTANQANRVGRQSMERYHGGAGVGAVGNGGNCAIVPASNFGKDCSVSKGDQCSKCSLLEVGLANDGDPMDACQSIASEWGPGGTTVNTTTLCNMAKQGGFEDVFNDGCTDSQFIAQYNCSGGGGGPPPPPLPECNCSPQMWREQCGCNSPSGMCNDPNISSTCNSCLKSKITAFQKNNKCTVGSGSNCGNCLNGLVAGSMFCPNNDSTCCGLCPNS